MKKPKFRKEMKKNQNLYQHFFEPLSTPRLCFFLSFAVSFFFFLAFVAMDSLEGARFRGVSEHFTAVSYDVVKSKGLEVIKRQ